MWQRAVSPFLQRRHVQSEDTCSSTTCCKVTVFTGNHTRKFLHRTDETSNLHHRGLDVMNVKTQSDGNALWRRNQLIFKVLQWRVSFTHELLINLGKSYRHFIFCVHLFKAWKTTKRQQCSAFKETLKIRFLYAPYRYRPPTSDFI